MHHLMDENKKARISRTNQCKDVALILGFLDIENHFKNYTKLYQDITDRDFLLKMFNEDISTLLIPGGGLEETELYRDYGIEVAESILVTFVLDIFTRIRLEEEDFHRLDEIILLSPTKIYVRLRTPKS